MTEGHAAIHAARALGANFFLRKFVVDLKPVIDSLNHWTAQWNFSRVLQEPGDFSHEPPLPARAGRRLALDAPGHREFSRLRQALELRGHAYIRAGTPSRTSAASAASFPGPTGRADFQWSQRAWLSGFEGQVHPLCLEPPPVPLRICCTARLQIPRFHHQRL